MQAIKEKSANACIASKVINLSGERLLTLLPKG